MSRDPLEAVAVVYDGLCTFEFGILVELFGLPRPEFEQWYRFRVASVGGRRLRAAGGLAVAAPHSLRILDSAGTILIPGWRSPDEPVPPALVRKLREAHAQGARIASVCSGAFVLAATGLLDGKRAATHWRYARALAERFPEIQVDADVLYVDEGSLITSAGSAAGIDMGLHLIRRDHGVAIANRVARRLVVPPHRGGGQKQYIDAPVTADHGGDSLTELLDEVRASPAEAHTIDSMAQRVNMSRRTLTRRFKAITGTSPHRWLQRERARVAQELLETTSLSMDRIAEESGFSDPQLLRLHFKRVVGTPPMEYRRNFRRPG